MRLDIRPLKFVCHPQALRFAFDSVRELLSYHVPELVIINDPQRNTASLLAVEAIRHNFDWDATRLLVATGSHRFSTEIRLAFEAPLHRLGFNTIGWHDAQAPDLVDIGGWRAHPWLAAARTILAIGSVEPHYFAGYTGAHKTMTIGCASYADIERNHAGAMDPACHPCCLETSPVHQGVLAMLRALESGRRLVAINLFQIGDKILAAAGGTLLATLDELTPLVKQTYLHEIEQPADVVIARVKSPLGDSVYQADKGIKNNEAAVRNGGVLILEAACPQGVGQDAFFQQLKQAPDYRSARALVETRGYRLGDHKAVRLRYLTDPACRSVRLFIVSPGMSAAEAQILGATKADSADDALQRAKVNEGNARIFEVEDAGNMCLAVCGR